MMRRGAWHQCGDKSQTIAQELLEAEVGVGVVISPRDLSFPNANRRAAEYHDLEAEVLIDPQFYIPHFQNANLSSYPTSEFRTPVSELRRIGDRQLDELATALQELNRSINASAIIAPAVAYQTRSPGIATLNARLFNAARAAAENLGVPTYATVALGRTHLGSAQAVVETLSEATALDADGWYFSFEFDAERVPSSREAVYLCGLAALTLACTGLPVLHAYAGPMALLSLAFGATAAGIGHNQNLWRFSPERWQPSEGQGGGGGAPPRFFSSSLWGTIVHPDETARLPADLARRILTGSPYSGNTGTRPPDNWSRGLSNRHLVYVICRMVAELAEMDDARDIAHAARRRVENGARLYRRISDSGMALRDNANAYHVEWGRAIAQLLEQNEEEYDFLSMI